MSDPYVVGLELQVDEAWDIIERLTLALKEIRDATHTSAVVLRGMADDALQRTK